MTSTIQHQLNEEWDKLHPLIQQRFVDEPKCGESKTYEGVMHTIRRSFMGCVFAHLTKIIGNPLTPHEGTNVPMQVRLYKCEKTNGVCWERTYHYPNKAPYVVTSTKRESADGKMMECVGGGFGMLLHVYEQDTNLHFASYRYFWNPFGIRIPLPHCLTPGKTHVVHADLGDGDFRFTITMQHKNLGETFYQDGIFRVQGE
jgi:hypothetical protein